MSDTLNPDDLLSLDIDSLTLDEIDVIEDIIDGPLDSLAKPGAKKGRLLRAMAVVIRQRTDPTFTAEDAGRLKLNMKSVPANPTERSE